MTTSNTDTKRKAPKLPEAGQWPDKILVPALICSAIALIAGFLLAFFYAPPVNGTSVSGVEVIAGAVVSTKLLISQKIFYFHMPVAIVSFGALIFAAYYAIRYLQTRELRFDTCAKTAMEVALIFVICTMITGEMWTRFEWGVWWTWDPRLTTYLILMLIVIAYFVLRSAFAQDFEKRAVFGSVICIIACIDVPICYMITRIVPTSAHPVVLREGGMSTEMAIALVVCLVGMTLLGFAIYRLRFRCTRIEQRTSALKNAQSESNE